MASGYSVHGGPGRCYPIWMDFNECMNNADDPKECKDFRDDYLECLHHRKEFSRLNLFAKATSEQAKHGSGDNQPAGGGH